MNAQQQITPSTPIAVPAALVSAIRQYLGGQPFDQVALLIAALERCQPIPTQDGGNDAPTS